jgi:hypothetical protein
MAERALSEEVVLDREIKKYAVVIGFAVKADRRCCSGDDLQLGLIYNRRPKSWG